MTGVLVGPELNDPRVEGEGFGLCPLKWADLRSSGPTVFQYHGTRICADARGLRSAKSACIRVPSNLRLVDYADFATLLPV